VLWLAPEPDEPFLQLTASVWRAFPSHPPYEGAFVDHIPHLTVAAPQPGDAPRMRAAERVVQAGLPLSTRIDRVLLIAGAVAARSWRLLRELPLEQPSG
jgi:hypothetical protein